MAERPFVDHYEALQLSPSADGETVERVYRLLAKRYHPDTPASGNAERFNEVREAYETLSDPEARAAYDARYDRERNEVWQVFGQEASEDDRHADRRLFHALLSLLYAARRRNPDDAGLAPVHLERMLGTPREHLDFPLWYLRKRGLVEVQETGLLAITVEGVDKLLSGELAPSSRRLLASGQGDDGAGAGSEHVPPQADTEPGDGTRKPRDRRGVQDEAEHPEPFRATS